MNANYTEQSWADGDATKPLSAARMTHIEDGIAAVDTAAQAAVTAEVTRANGAYATKGAHQFRVGDYGAVGDGTTDDTAAIRAALAAAVTYAQAHTNYAEVAFADKVYKVAGALQQGSTTKGNAQIPLPVIATTAHKVTIALVGVGDVNSNAHWQQTVPQAGGSVIHSTMTGASYNNSFGLPSVIGGPTPEQGYGTTGAVFSNFCLVIDGIELQVEPNPSLCGFDLRGIAAANVRRASSFSRTTPAAPATIDNFTTALMMPAPGNNDYSEIGQWTVFGWFCGVGLGEHTNAVSIRAIGCTVGMRALGPYPHVTLVGYASVESCGTALGYVDVSPVAFSSPGATVRIGALDVEAVSTLVDDPSNHLYGDIHATNQFSALPAVTGGTHLTIVNSQA